ncbi:MAG: YlzJ-like family protein [Bacillota bacterium]
MLLYTPLPIELVMKGTEPIARFRETSVGGVPILVEEVSPGRGRLVRLLSTDPFDYLNPALTPGTEVAFTTAT